MTHLLIAALAFFPPMDDDGGNVAVRSQFTGYVISAHQKQGRALAPPVGTTKPKVTCSYQRWYANGQLNGGLEFVDPGSNPNSEPTKKGTYYLVECSNGFRDTIWLKKQPSSGDTPEQLARRAYKRIPIEAPRVLTAPPRGRDGLVGLPHWFFLAEGQWVAKSKRLSAGSVWGEATATPQRMTINTDDGQTFVCHGPGTAYDPARLAEHQRSTCSYRFQQPANARRVTVSVTWGGTWRGSGGAGGALPPITRSVTFPVRVVEAQALVTKG